MKLARTCILVIAGACGTAAADSIRIGGQVHENVYVQEGHSLYYVLVPEDGRVLNARKADLSPEDVRISVDSAEREALREQWRRRQPSLPPAPDSSSGSPRDARPAPESELAAGPGMARQEEPAPTGTSAGQPAFLPDSPHGTSARLKDVPLGEALKALLRSMNLDYRVVGGSIYVSTPDQLRETPAESLETRTYTLHSALGAALPKIVVRHEAASLAGGGGYAGGPANSGNAPGGSGGPAYGGGYGPGYGGGGYAGGRGGFGGNFGGGYAGDVTAISNISDMFSSIDDRAVGEAPAQPPGLEMR